MTWTFPGIRDQSLILGMGWGGGVQNIRGKASEDLSLHNVLAMLREWRGTERYGIFSTQVLEVIATLKGWGGGGAKPLHSLNVCVYGGGGRKGYTLS